MYYVDLLSKGNIAEEWKRIEQRWKRILLIDRQMWQVVNLHTTTTQLLDIWGSQNVEYVSCRFCYP